MLQHGGRRSTVPGSKAFNEADLQEFTEDPERAIRL
jgi:hypothetical protein